MSYKLTENKLDIINKCWRKPKGQLRMNNTETHETSGSRHRMKTNKTRHITLKSKKMSSKYQCTNIEFSAAGARIYN